MIDKKDFSKNIKAFEVYSYDAMDGSVINGIEYIHKDGTKIDISFLSEKGKKNPYRRAINIEKSDGYAIRFFADLADAREFPAASADDEGKNITNVVNIGITYKTVIENFKKNERSRMHNKTTIESVDFKSVKVNYLCDGSDYVVRSDNNSDYDVAKKEAVEKMESMEHLQKIISENIPKVLPIFDQYIPQKLGELREYTQQPNNSILANIHGKKGISL